MIGGESYRVGQIGGFFRVPLGYTNLYAVCTQIGADAAPPGSAEKAFGAALEDDMQLHLSGYRWMTIVLFGEALGGEFERGVGQYPTVGDEVHLVTNDDLKVIYGWAKGRKARSRLGASIVIDPHGEYATALGDRAAPRQRFRSGPVRAREKTVWGHPEKIKKLTP
jgi:hypothetical protein